MNQSAAPRPIDRSMRYGVNSDTSAMGRVPNRRHGLIERLADHDELVRGHVPDGRKIAAAVGGDLQLLRGIHEGVVPVPHVHVGLLVRQRRRRCAGAAAGVGAAAASQAAAGFDRPSRRHRASSIGAGARRTQSATTAAGT